MLRRLIAKRRALSTTALELAGFGLIVRGIWFISATAGWISAGVALLLVGVLTA